MSDKTKFDLNSKENIKERIENNLLLQIMQELGHLKDQHRLQIFVTHGFLELLMNVLIKAYAKNEKKISQDNRSFPYSIKILLLHELNVLNDDDYAIYDWFRKLRNRAAHDPLFKLTENDLQRIKPNKFSKIDNFHKICIDLALRLWNRHKDVLAPEFAPTLTKLNI